jgi:hypothetical protein
MFLKAISREWSMKKNIMILIMPISLFAQQMVADVTIDSSQYYTTQFSYGCARIPGLNSTNRSSDFDYILSCTDFFWVWQTKNVDQYDLFNLSGKIGTVTIRESDIPTGYYFSNVRFSQTILNSDDAWEYIVVYSGSGKSLFKVFDGSNNLILSDTGNAHYGYDGRNTYVFSYTTYQPYRLKTWRFRTNVGSTSQPLAKSSASAIGPIMDLTPSGNFRVALQPAGIRKTTVQIFDMLGREIFNQTIPEVKSPTSFMIPSSDIPRSAFFAKVNNGNGTFVKKEIPVH